MDGLVLYTRRGCGICRRLQVMIEEEIEDRENVHLEVVDIDHDPGLAEQFRLRVPVLLRDGRILVEGRADATEVRAVLDALPD